MSDDKRRRTLSRSPPPQRSGRGGHDDRDDSRGGGRGGRYDRDRDRDRDYDRDRERNRDYDRTRGAYQEERGGGGRSAPSQVKDEPSDDAPGPRQGIDGDRGRRQEREGQQREREDRGGGRGGGDGGGVKRDLDSERDGDDWGEPRGGRDRDRDREGGGGGAGRDAKRERGNGDWGGPPGRGGGGGGGGGGRRGGGRGRGRDRDDDGGGGRGGESSKYMSQEEREAREREAEEAARPKAPKEQPNLGLSGKLAAETNKVAGGVELKHVPPPEAKLPDKRWRLYIFKNDQLQDEPYRIHRMNHYLFGRDVTVADIITAHPSCSKQHAVLQFRLTPKEDEYGLTSSAVRPYLLDLGSVNGTFLNGERLEALRYYELLEKDVVRFGQSTREYVLLHDNSGDD